MSDEYHSGWTVVSIEFDGVPQIASPVNAHMFMNPSKYVPVPYPMISVEKVTLRVRDLPGAGPLGISVFNANFSSCGCAVKPEDREQIVTLFPRAVVKTISMFELPGV